MLVLAGSLSLVAALAHLGVIVGGPDWYRFFGAGEEMAVAAERGSWRPTVITMGIAALLAVWALYAFSGAGRIARLPLLRTGLVVIAAIYLARGLILVPLLAWRPEVVDGFTLWSSLIVLAHGLAHAIGTWLAWGSLARPGPAASRTHG